MLKVSNLAVGYQKNTIVRDISFELQSNELCAVVGVNGIGKSTLLRTLGRLQPKINGTIYLDKTNLSTIKNLDLAKLQSMVLTEPIATKNLTVFEIIALGRQPYTNWLGALNATDKKIIETCLQSFSLHSLKQKKCFELSDGQLQRVLIARAVVQDTPLILLDEPTTHLDISHKVEILMLLKTLAKSNNKTLLFTTHEVDLAIQLCDKILILDGKTNPFGEPCKLIENGCFDTLFPTDLIRFDANSGTFKIKQ